MSHDPHIYNRTFVQQLFDEMSGTYGFVNMVTSFGFSRRWRRRCVAEIEIPKSSQVVDLMTGMGELFPSIAPRVGDRGNLIAIDISPVMCQRAKRHEHGNLACPVEVLEADALESDLPTASADVVLSSFGLKTFSAEQIEKLAQEVHRILKPNGCFSFVEISVPPSRWLRAPYMFYLRRIIPFLGWLFMGNPENYRLLGIYTTLFRNCDAACRAFQTAGLHAETQSYFFGCATGIVGHRPSVGTAVKHQSG